MTPVLSPDISETTFPGTSRRVWRAPAVRSHALVVLTPGRFYLAPADGESADDAATALAAGVELNEVLGPQATAIDLADVTRLRLDLEANSLSIESAGGQPVTVVFATAETGDEVYTRLWKRLGPAVTLRPFRPDVWTAAREPVGVMAGVLLATAVLAVCSDAAADLAGPSSAWSRLLAVADWRWVCGLGGALLAFAQVWLYRRLTRPPARLELVRR